MTRISTSTATAAGVVTPPDTASTPPQQIRSSSPSAPAALADLMPGFPRSKSDVIAHEKQGARVRHSLSEKVTPQSYKEATENEYRLINPEKLQEINEREYRVELGDVSGRFNRELEAAKSGLKENANKDYKASVIDDNFGDSGAIPVSGSYDQRTDIHYETSSGGTGVAHAQGARQTMEDAHVATTFNVSIAGKETPIHLHGVFDGHGGDACAQYAKENIAKTLQRRLEYFNPKELTDTGIYNALKISMVDLSRGFEGGSSEEDPGTTANVSLVIDKHLYVANTGDSRAILVTPNEVIQLSEDAKPKSQKYQKGVKNRGGRVLRGRVNMHLAVARSLGDHAHTGAVSARPKVTKYPLPDGVEDRKGWYVTHVCDGVVDVASSEQVGNLIQARAREGISPTKIAAEIVKSSYVAGSGDNLSALVVPVASMSR